MMNRQQGGGLPTHQFSEAALEDFPSESSESIVADPAPSPLFVRDDVAIALLDSMLAPPSAPRQPINRVPPLRPVLQNLRAAVGRVLVSRAFLGSAAAILVASLAVSLWPLVRQPSPPAPLQTASLLLWEPLRSPVPAAAGLRPPAVIEPAAPQRASIEPARRAIQGSLNRFRDALSILDAAAVKRLWPNVDEGALRTRFATLHEQNLEFDACTISVASGSATAVCNGTLTYARLASRRSSTTERRQWRFRFEGAADRWTIARVDVAAR